MEIKQIKLLKQLLNSLKLQIKHANKNGILHVKKKYLNNITIKS